MAEDWPGDCPRIGRSFGDAEEGAERREKSDLFIHKEALMLRLEIKDLVAGKGLRGFLIFLGAIRN
jgi:hypothetical protein